MGYIYLMTNQINGLQYVGQTSLTIEARMIGHKHEAKVCIPNVYFVRAMHKYGFENFKVEVLEECQDDQLDEREIYWIAEYDTFLGPGYNSTRGGRGNKKFLNTDILDLWNSGYSRQEIANKLNCNPTTVTNSLRALNISPKAVRSRAQSLICKKKEVLQYNLLGELVATYPCVDDAAKINNCNSGIIRAVCNHHLPTAIGYIWCHLDEPKPIQQLIEEIPISKKNRKINQYDLQGNLIASYISCAEASRQLNVHYSSIENAANGVSLSCLSTLWQYDDDKTDINIKVNKYRSRKDYKKRAVNQYDLNNNYINTYDSASAAAEAIGKPGNGSSITKACNGKLKTAYKFKWAYVQA